MTRAIAVVWNQESGAIIGRPRAERNPRPLAFVLLGMLLAGGLAFGQSPVTGTPPFSTQAPSTFDTVNEGNLNVSFAIPVVSKAGRGMPFQYSLVYNNSVWSRWASSGGLGWTPVGNWGWGGASTADAGYATYLTTNAKCYYPQGPNGKWYYWNVYNFAYYYSPNGTQYTINTMVSTWTSSLPCGSGAPYFGTTTTNDGSGLTITVTASPSTTVYTRSGLTLTVPTVGSQGNQTGGTVLDTNGNFISATTASGTTTFTDTLNATALRVAGSGTPSSPVTYTYTNPSGGTSQITLNYQQYTVETNFGCSGIPDYGATIQTYAYLVHSVVLPDGTSYVFQYEATPQPTYSGAVTGRIAQVELPTGGIISYTYSGGSNGIYCLDGGTPTLTRVVNPGGTWT